MAANEVRDVVMIGAGPSALAAAVYTTREDFSTVLYEKGVVGGLAALTDWIDNYPGFVKGISGLDLANHMQGQAERFGADIRYGEVSKISRKDDLTLVETSEGSVLARAVLIATGSAYRKLGVPGEEKYYGRGLHFCATCDGAFYKGKRIIVVGGGNSAVQEAIFLLKFADHVDLLVRSEVKASEVLQQELSKKVKEKKITVHLGVTPTEVAGTDAKVTEVLALQNGKKTSFKTDGVFIFIGLVPNTGFLKGSQVSLDDQGFIVTDAGMQTTMPGVFASGDVRSGATMQIASAVGEGATAALKIRAYIEMREHKKVTAPTEFV